MAARSNGFARQLGSPSVPCWPLFQWHERCVDANVREPVAVRVDIMRVIRDPAAGKQQKRITGVEMNISNQAYEDDGERASPGGASPSERSIDERRGPIRESLHGAFSGTATSGGIDKFESRDVFAVAAEWFYFATSTMFGDHRDKELADEGKPLDPCSVPVSLNRRLRKAALSDWLLLPAAVAENIADRMG